MYIGRISAVFDVLDTHQVGTPQLELGEPFFALPVEQHVIFFIPTATVITVVRILSQSQDSAHLSYREHGLPVFENLLKQDFDASGPNQKGAGDITYFRTDEGWLYLAVVIDLWSRAVIGWSMSSRMTSQLALWRRKRTGNVIVHTDYGGQYVHRVIRPC